VHTGLPVLPALQLPANSNTSTSNDSTVTHLSWQLLAIPTVDIESHAVLLISRLPALPTLDSESKSNTASAAVAASGVFASAKNAMLLRERAKEAGRALDVVIASKGFPTLIQNNLIDEKLGDSVLVVGDREGKAHFYLGGSGYMGSVEIQKDASIIGVSVLPKSTLTPNAPSQISILLSRLDYRIATSTLELRLPSTTLLLAQQTTLLREMIQHAFESLQEARVLWDEARRVATAWLARLAELGEPHGGEKMIQSHFSTRGPHIYDFAFNSISTSNYPAHGPTRYRTTQSRSARFFGVKDERTRFYKTGNCDDISFSKIEEVYFHVIGSRNGAISSITRRSEIVVHLVR
jgi:hypothetical protein